MKTLCVLFLIGLVSNHALAFRLKRQTNVQGSDVDDSAAATRACIAQCPVTSEYNPVCGSDRTTYTNPGRLECAKFCGVNVTLFRAAPCPPSVVTPQ